MIRPKLIFSMPFLSTYASRLNESAFPPLQQQEMTDISYKQHSLFLVPTNEAEVEQIIRKLKNKAGGNDDIHAFTIELAVPFITPIMAYVINNAIVGGEFPQQFKSADVCPDHPDGPKSLVNNYQPIALISNLAKVFEKIIFSRLYNFAFQTRLN